MDRRRVNVCRLGFGEVSKEDEKKIIEILNMSTIAVVGISPKEDRPSNYVPRYMQERGYKIVPIRPGAKEILGSRCYRDLEDVEEAVDVVDVFRRGEFCAEIAKKAVKIGAKALWLQEGIVSYEARKIAENAGLIVVMDYCLEKAYSKYMENNRYL